MTLLHLAGGFKVSFHLRLLKGIRFEFSFLFWNLKSEVKSCHWRFFILLKEFLQKLGILSVMGQQQFFFCQKKRIFVRTKWAHLFMRNNKTKSLITCLSLRRPSIRNSVLAALATKVAQLKVSKNRNYFMKTSFGPKSNVQDFCPTI